MVMVNHDLADYYNLVCQMKHYHNWDLEYIDNMLPWQFDIYVNNIIRYIQEEKEARELEERKRQDENRNN